jgi:hypothetical protein
VYYITTCIEIYNIAQHYPIQEGNIATTEMIYGTLELPYFSRMTHFIFPARLRLGLNVYVSNETLSSLNSTFLLEAYLFITFELSTFL